MEGAAVKLIIKAPNQQIKDQIVQCDVGWTIGRLKEYLSEVYPSKPESRCQKLIYSGQLLNDSTYLKDVLRQYDGQGDHAYTVHLVCAPQKTCANKSTPEKVQATENTSTASTTRNNIEAIRLNSTNSVQNQSRDSNNVTTQHTSAQLFSTQYFDPHNSQQVAWMQQAYTHYFTQYMQLMAAQGIQLQTSIPYIQQMNINSTDNAQNPYINSINNNAGDEQTQPVVQDPADVNAENNDGAAEEGAFNQDWLDVFYMFSRIVLLFSIVYFYSSPVRFLVVTFLGFVIYLYQGGFIRVQPALIPENNNGRADNNNQVLQNEAAGARGAAAQQNGQAQTGQTEPRTNANEEIEEERPGALAFTWTFFSSFFASLIPDEPNI